jgi:hypothetical protein
MEIVKQEEEIMMKIEVTDLVLGKSCIQDTKDLKNHTENSFLRYLNQKEKENILTYRIL